MDFLLLVHGYPPSNRLSSLSANGDDMTAGPQKPPLESWYPWRPGRYCARRARKGAGGGMPRTSISQVGIVDVDWIARAGRSDATLSCDFSIRWTEGESVKPVLPGDSSGMIQTDRPNKANAATPRTRRFLTLRATDRRRGRKSLKTLCW